MNESDDDLIARVKGGDIAAFEGIVKRYQDRIYNICVYMLKDRQKAQEAAQDVFVKAYGNLANELSAFTVLKKGYFQSDERRNYAVTTFLGLF
jgi:DNA-directed RNA polymerase specialized sigma24 family protein